MTYETGTQTEVLWAGPPAAYTAGGGSSTSAFALTIGSTGNYQQPLIRGLLLQQGRSNQVISAEGSITVSGTTSTTLTVTALLATSPNQTTGSTLMTFPAFTVSSYSSAGVWFKTTTINRGSGYGTTATATNLATYGLYLVGPNGASGVVPTTTLNTLDFSVNQWITLIGQFNTNSATNSAQLTELIVRGEN